MGKKNKTKKTTSKGAATPVKPEPPVQVEAPAPAEVDVVAAPIAPEPPVKVEHANQNTMADCESDVAVSELERLEQLKAEAAAVEDYELASSLKKQIAALKADDLKTKADDAALTTGPNDVDAQELTASDSPDKQQQVAGQQTSAHAIYPLWLTIHSLRCAPRVLLTALMSCQSIWQ